MAWREELHPRRPDGEFTDTPGGGDWASKLSALFDGRDKPNREQVRQTLESVPLHFSDAITNAVAGGALRGPGPSARSLQGEVTNRIKATGVKPGHEVLADGYYQTVEDVVKHDGGGVTVYTEDSSVDFQPGETARISGLRSPLVAPAIDAAIDYVGHRYGETNSLLRGGQAQAVQGDVPGARIADVHQRIAALDAVMAASKTQQDLTLFRALRTGLPADTWVDQGFGSTTADPTHMAAILRGAEHPVEMQVRVPRGTGAVVMSPASIQAEVLLQRGLRYRVVEDLGVSGGVHRVVVTVEPVAP